MSDARERIAEVMMGWYENDEPDPPTDATIAIVREAMLSEAATRAFDRATGFEVPVTYTEGMKLRDISDGIENALDAAFGATTRR